MKVIARIGRAEWVIRREVCGNMERNGRMRHALSERGGDAINCMVVASDALSRIFM